MSDLTELITRVQREFGDDNEVQITKSDIVRWANDGQLEIVRRLEGEKTSGNATAFNLVAGSRLLNDPNFDFISIQYINILAANGSESYGYLTRVTRKYMMDHFPSWLDGKDRGRPRYYHYDGSNGGSINLFPAADSAYQLLVYGAVRPSLLVVGGNEDFAIPAEAHDDLTQYCLRRAFELDADWPAAQIKHERFKEQLAESVHSAKFPYSDGYPVVQDVDGAWD